MKNSLLKTLDIMHLFMDYFKVDSLSEAHEQLLVKLTNENLCKTYDNIYNECMIKTKCMTMDTIVEGLQDVARIFIFNLVILNDFFDGAKNAEKLLDECLLMLKCEQYSISSFILTLTKLYEHKDYSIEKYIFNYTLPYVFLKNSKNDQWVLKNLFNYSKIAVYIYPEKFIERNIEHLL